MIETYHDDKGFLTFPTTIIPDAMKQSLLAQVLSVARARASDSFSCYGHPQECQLPSQRRGITFNSSNKDCGLVFLEARKNFEVLNRTDGGREIESLRKPLIERKYCTVMQR